MDSAAGLGDVRRFGLQFRAGQVSSPPDYFSVPSFCTQLILEASTHGIRSNPN